MKNPIQLALLVVVLVFLRSTPLKAQCTAPVTPTITPTAFCAGSATNGTLSATGISSLQTSWYVNAYGGNAIGTGSAIAVPTTAAVYYVAQLAPTSTQSLTLPPHGSIYSTTTRGYYFTAPVDFVITGLRVPTDASTGSSNIAVLKFTNGAPPIYSSVTNSFNTLYLTQNNSSTGIISVNIPVYAGDIIGILGDRADNNSYANVAPYSASLGSNTLTLNRMGMQYALSTNAPIDIWSEASGNISRVEMYTTLGCLNSLTAYTLTPSTPPTLNISGTSASVCAGAAVNFTAGGASTYSWSNGVSTASLNANPLSTTGYTVTGFSASGCSSTLAVTASVNPLPLVAITGPSATCSGTTITLTAGGAGSYLWNTSVSTLTIDVAPTTNSVYSVIGTDAVTNCSATAIHSILVNANPTLAILTPTSSCSGQTITLTGSGADIYSWNSGTIAPSISPSPTISTLYTLSGTITATGCSESTTTLVTVLNLPVISINSPASACKGTTVSLSGSGADTYTWSTGAPVANITQTINASTVYTLSGTSMITGCKNTTTIQIVSLPNPTVSASIPTIACAGQGVTLTASGAHLYNWSNGSTLTTQIDTLYVTTDFTVTGTSSVTGCFSSAVGQVNVISSPTLTINLPTPICAGSSASLFTSGADTYSWSTGSLSSSITVNPPVTSIYTVTGTYTSTGCKSLASTTVLVNPAPVLPIIGASQICIGESLNLTTGGANTYSWNTGATTAIISVTPAATTVFTVTGTNTITGCKGSSTHAVLVNPLPEVGVISERTLVCTSDAQLNLIGTPSGGFYYGQNVNNNTFNPNIFPGVYTAVYSYTDMLTACSNTSSVAITVDVCSSLSTENAIGFRVFPNPGAGEFFVEFNDATLKTIQVIDLSGRLLSERTTDAQKSSIDLRAYANGVYYLKIKSAASLNTFKIIKN
ncbi:hypothetical protein CNR22_14820 [Sphingobacteriaceae bacterium]|nr:hypothetical protein CNR22_14820 [Sphingobacteriaceae bacterium]